MVDAPDLGSGAARCASSSLASRTIPSKRCTDGVSPSGKAPVFDTGIPWFESRYPSHISSIFAVHRDGIGVSPSGKAPVFDTGIPWFESRYPSQSMAGKAVKNLAT